MFVFARHPSTPELRPIINGFIIYIDPGRSREQSWDSLGPSAFVRFLLQAEDNYQHEITCTCVESEMRVSRGVWAM